MGCLASFYLYFELIFKFNEKPREENDKIDINKEAVHDHSSY
jgi:hypothetical protein